MSRGRVLVILLIVFLVLGAWYRWVERRRPAPPPEDSPRVFLAVEPTRVVGLTAIFAGDTTRMEKRDGAWRIVSPVDFPADPIAVEAVLSRCRRLVVMRSFAPDPGSRGRYGLDRSDNELWLRLDGGGEERLEIGGPAAAAEAFYVRLAGRDSIGLYPDREVYNFFRRSTAQWRDPSLMVFSTTRTVRVDLASGDHHVRLERNAPDGRWRVTLPFAGAARQSDVEELVKGIRAMKAVSFPADGAVDWKSFGLDRPTAFIEVIESGGEAYRLDMGGPVPGTRDRELYGRATGHSNVYGVPFAYRDLARRSDMAFRERRLMALPRKLWSQMILSAGDRRVTIRPDSAGIWRVDGEEGTPGAPPADRTDLVDLWSGLEADSIVAAPPAGPGTEALRLELFTAAGTREEYRIEPARPSSPGELWPAWPVLRDPPRPGELFLLPGDPVRRGLALLGSR